MSLANLGRRGRWGLYVVVTGLALAAGCPPEETEIQDNETDELTDDEVLAAWRQVHPLMIDLPLIRVPVELKARNDDNAKEALRLLATINSFKENDPLGGLAGDAAPNDKSIRRMKADGWQRRCDSLACYYTKKQGDLTMTWTHLLGLPTAWQSFLTWNGCDGKHEYEEFMLEHWHITRDLKLAVLTHYQYPDPPPCGDGKAAIGPGILFRWTFKVIDGGVLYTPGQVTYLDTRRYTAEQWHYHSLIGEFLQFTMLVCTSYPDDRLVFEHYSQKLSEPRLMYLSYRGVWDQDLRYCWTSYRENGTVLSCGGDMGCPDCGP